MNNSSKTLRPFRPSDLDAVLHIFHEAVHTTGAKYYSKEQVDAWAPKQLHKEEWLASLLANITYVVEIDDKVVAFGDMTSGGYVDRLFVLKEYQGRAIPLTILKKLEEEARRLDVRELTVVASIIAMPVARRLGWEIVSEEQKAYNGQEFLVYNMRKSL